MTTEEMLGRLDERQKAMLAKLELVYDEVKKTNGRVSALETWKSGILGGWRATTVISALIGAVIGFLTNFLL
jgi:hypothetical protein